MKKLPLPRTTPWLTGAAAGLVTFTGGERLAAAPWVHSALQPIERTAELQHFTSGYDHVLGTSLDLVVEAVRPAEAIACEAQILGEIERLRRILSTYDPASEIRQVMAGASVQSAELHELLALYDTWSARTGGLIDVRLGGVIDAWRRAARAGQLPATSTLAAAARRERAYNVDALGKGYIIDRAVSLARRYAPGGVLNLGGDIRAWGDTAWSVGVADPSQPADNAAPLARYTLRNAAMTTSGGYARFFEIAGQRFSHLIDPRTQRPIAVGGSATIVAADSVTANALSTSASLAGREVGAGLARTQGASGYYLVDAAGEISASGGFTSLAASGESSSSAPAQPSAPAPSPSAPAAPDKGASDQSAPSAPAANAAWPQGFQVVLQIVLKKHEGERQIFRPYTAIWIQNARGQIVRTLSVWGSDERWQRKLTAWWNAPAMGQQEPSITSRATRTPGTYTIAWNGLDDFGRRLPAGTYTVCLEVCREAGNHILDRVSLVCGDDPATAGFKATQETEAGTISYGLPPKP